MIRKKSSFLIIGTEFLEECFRKITGEEVGVLLFVL